MEVVGYPWREGLEVPERWSTIQENCWKRSGVQFLLRLNKDLDDVRGRILSIKPLPNVREAFSKVCQEESQTKVMLGTQHSFSSAENSALSVWGAQSNCDKQQRNKPVSDHCRKIGHTKDTCWKIHGEPVNWKLAWEREVHGNTTESQNT